MAKAQKMRRWSDKKGGYEATPDGFDRSRSDTLASLIDEWFRRLEERAYSLRTVEAHKWALRMFVRWAEERELRTAHQVTRPILESYQRWLFRYRQDNGKPLGVTTQRMRLGAVQRFFAWLCKDHRLDANPAADLELPRKPNRSLPKALSLVEVETVLNVPDVTDALGVRDRAILETLYATGIRRSEVVRLDVDDLDRERGVLTVRKGKGGKDRVVPVGERAVYWLGKYLEHTRPLLETAASERALFLTGYGERFSSTYLGNWVRRVIESAKIGHLGSCHVFRHSCATHMLENGADIRFIQQMLGHARLDTTQIYTEVSIIQLREVHSRTHPHARIRPACPAVVPASPDEGGTHPPTRNLPPRKKT
ncbi:MAG: site-specific tyrosine recombinase XerC [Kiritimatiellae bacterium]|nr:site-specific tyrosine recombinase XerC [Kiritimatiellia bacterium]